MKSSTGEQARRGPGAVAGGGPSADQTVKVQAESSISAFISVSCSGMPRALVRFRLAVTHGPWRMPDNAKLCQKRSPSRSPPGAAHRQVWRHAAFNSFKAASESAAISCSRSGCYGGAGARLDSLSAPLAALGSISCPSALTRVSRVDRPGSPGVSPAEVLARVPPPCRRPSLMPTCHA